MCLKHLFVVVLLQRLEISFRERTIIWFQMDGNGGTTNDTYEAKEVSSGDMGLFRVLRHLAHEAKEVLDQEVLKDR